VKAAVEFAEASPEPPLDTMYESLYARTEPGGWYAIDERSPEPHRGEDEAEMPEAARELAEAGAAYAEQSSGERHNPAAHGERPNPAAQGDVQEGDAEGVQAPDREVGEEGEEISADRGEGEEDEG